MNDFKGTAGDWKFRKWDGEKWPDKRWSVGTVDNISQAICISPKFFTDGEESEANGKLIAGSKNVLRELIHLVRLLEPLEKDGSLNVPGLATLNGARKAIEESL